MHHLEKGAGDHLAPVSLPVVGVPHLNADKSSRHFEILLSRAGELVELRPEPRSKHSTQAIAVFSCRGIQIGYLSGRRAPHIGALLDRVQVKAVFQRPAAFGAWVRVAFNGEEPTLTDAMLRLSDNEPGKWVGSE